MLSKTRITILALAGAIAMTGAADASSNARPGTPRCTKHSTHRGHRCARRRSRTITIAAPVAEQPTTTTIARTAPTAVGTRLQDVATVTTSALEVDGADGGYGRIKCENLLDQWNQLTDKAVTLEEQSGGQGPETASAASYLQEAQEVYQDMSDNCLVVD